MNPGIAVALVAAVCGPLLTYIIATRKLSGRIETSEASSLWQESADIRKEYRDRIADSEKRQAHLEERIGIVEGKNNDLMRENLDLHKLNIDQGDELRRCNDRIGALERENGILKSTIQAIGGFDEDDKQ